MKPTPLCRFSVNSMVELDESAHFKSGLGGRNHSIYCYGQCLLDPIRLASESGPWVAVSGFAANHISVPSSGFSSKSVRHRTNIFNCFLIIVCSRFLFLPGTNLEKYIM